MPPTISTPPVIALLTDMGTNDWFVGTMKGVALSICPQAQLVDVCHEITKQSIQEAAFVLEISHGYFPEGTIFLCVVDPGVGTERRAVVARNDKYYFVGPDNGAFSFVEMKSKNWEAHLIENPQYLLQKRSGTFHGRDLFAPAAAHLAMGAPFEEFGPGTNNLHQIPTFEQVMVKGNLLSGRIIYIDSYGNLLTNVTPAHIPQGVDEERVKLSYHGRSVHGISPHYADVPPNHPLMYWGSSGFLEVAINMGSAQRKWQAQTNDWFEMEWSAED
jgi:S-adenosyl-L-methionine hydrolase (adenosine-forming)